MKVGKKSAPMKPKAVSQESAKPRAGPKSPSLSPPSHLNEKPTPQRNDSIISEAIFGVDVSVVAIAPRQWFSANYAKIVELSQEMFSNYRADEKQIDRIVTKEEAAYYATSMLWCKLIDIKAKDGDRALTSEEKAIRKAVSDETFNVPEPLFIYLSQLGNYTDSMGKETRLELATLPITVVQQFGGYHAAGVTADTHNLFEEVPSLGIAGDMVMALASQAPEPIPNFHIAKPANTEFTENLIGRISPIGVRRPEIAQRLAGMGITSTTFHEYVAGTRFNLKYIQSLSDIFGQFE